jgi:hypothetical protein
LRICFDDLQRRIGGGGKLGSKLLYILVAIGATYEDMQMLYLLLIVNDTAVRLTFWYTNEERKFIMWHSKHFLYIGPTINSQLSSRAKL